MYAAVGARVVWRSVQVFNATLNQPQKGNKS